MAGREDRARTYGYRAFGFFLASNVPVPGLKESSNPGLPVVSLEFGQHPPDFDEVQYREVWYTSRYTDPSGAPAVVILHAPALPDDGQLRAAWWIQYADGTSVFVGQGVNKVWVTWPEGSSQEEACTYLLGPVMAILAQLRGSTCLHGSAVVIDNRIVGFLGPQGAGKSTTATAFARAGYPVVADDLILLLESENGFAVDFTYPVLRLWPGTVRMLFGHEDALPHISRGWDKRGLDLSEGEYTFQTEPLPLAALYILGPRSDDAIAPYLNPVTGAPALLGLVSNSWAHYAAKPAILAAQLRVLTRVSRCIPIRALVAHSDHNRLPELFDLIAADVRSIRADGPGNLLPPVGSEMGREHLTGPIARVSY
jgi:hypothetical protein